MSNTNLIDGMKVKVSGRYGEVVEIGDQVKVKFENGDFGFFDVNEVQPVVLETRLKSSENVLMESTAVGEDPMAQPKIKTGREVGEDQNVLGKSVNTDVFSKKESDSTFMAKKKMKKEEEKEEMKKEEDKEETKKEEDKKEDEDKAEKEYEEEEESAEKEMVEEPELEKENSDEDYSEMTEEEKKMYLKLKSKVKKRCKKEAGNGQDPQEAAEDGKDENSSITPNESTPSQPQHVLVPESDVEVSREQPQQPVEEKIGKSYDVNKSPVFVSITKQLNALQESLETKVEAVKKSVNDRLANIEKDMEKVEKFYSQSFYKAAGENVGPESVRKESISKQLEKGNVRFRN